MNANELAGLIELAPDYIQYRQEAATMLRQQQADLSDLQRHIPAKYCPSENNAAYEKGFIDGMAKMTESAVHRAVEGMAAKTLTDEEITAISKEIFKDYKNYHHYQIDFARAILRKAQEK